MRIYLQILLLVLIMPSISSCKRPTHSEYPVIPVNKILSSPEYLMTYWNQYVKFDGNFHCLDTSGTSMSNRDFLRLLTTGKFVPLRLESANDSLYYRLYRIDQIVSSDFGQIVGAYAQNNYLNYLRIGEKFPAFNYIDLNGNSYTSQSTRGKILVIKFWFINCANCVLEMPKCNEILDQYKGKSNIIFLSLAFDPPLKLKNFLSKTKFDMPVVPVNEGYVQKTLGVTSFPTIMIIKDGKIASIFENIADFESVVKGL